MGCGAFRGSSQAVHPELETDTAAAILPNAPASAPVPTAVAAADMPVTAACLAVSSTALAPGPSEDAKKVVPTTAPRARPKPKATLIKAVKDNDLALIDELLSGGASLEALGMWDNTPLLVACTYAKTEAALSLIHHKANVNARNEHDATPLHYAAVEGLLSVVEALVGAVEGEEAKQKLANCGPAKVYNRHLDTYGRRTPLVSAAESGFVDVCSVLFAAGASIEGASEDGRTAIWLAARNAKVAVVKFLLQQGVDVGAKDADGVSVLEAATTTCNEEIISALLSHGIADVNDTVGSPLFAAVKAGKRSIVEALLTNGAAVNPKSSAGDDAVAAKVPAPLALHAACEKGDEYLISLLVRYRADATLSNAAGLTAFDLLRRRGFPDAQIMKLLRPPDASHDGSTGGAGAVGDCVGEASRTSAELVEQQ